MNIKESLDALLSILSKYNSFLIFIKGSPDPDVIASSFALKLICDTLKKKSEIVSLIKPSLPQNNAIIKELDIPVSYVDKLENLSEYDAYCVLDFQSAFVEGVTGNIPCAVHVDHHEPVEEKIEIGFNLILNEAGSVSSFFALIIREMNDKFDASVLEKICTALLFGIFTDTDEYRHAARIDFEALEYVSYHFDKKIIEYISEIPLPKHIISLISKAFEKKEEYKDWIFAGIGFIDESIRDSIPIIADILIRRFNSKVVIVFAAVIKKKPGKNLRLDASFRTEDENIDLNMLIKEISQSGGGRKYKGAYQVDLNYFADCPDKALLWSVIESSTIAHLKYLRDQIQYIKMKGLYNKIIRKAGDIFKF